MDVRELREFENWDFGKGKKEACMKKTLDQVLTMDGVSS